MTTYRDSIYDMVAEPERYELTLIALRAIRLPALEGRSLADVHLDLTTVHARACPLDLLDLKTADKEAFERDILGIVNNLDRLTGDLLNDFVPAFARASKAGE